MFHSVLNLFMLVFGVFSVRVDGCIAADIDDNSGQVRLVNMPFLSHFS